MFIVTWRGYWVDKVSNMEECVKCGRCCSNLRKGDEKTGLTLFPEETHLFPEDKIRPYLGKGEASVTEIFTYQHTENVCINLVNNQCTVYENRPTMCRSFPVKVGEHGLRFISGCMGVRDMLKNAKNMTHEMYEVKAAIKMTERLYEFHKAFTEGEKRWVYNLVTEEWETY